MLTLGIKNRLESVSTKERFAEFLGSGNVPVYAAIMMIGLMAQTCLERRSPFLGSRTDTVGVFAIPGESIMHS